VILNRLGDEPPARIVALPLVVRKKTAAVLYADSADLDSEAINLEALETLVRVSGMAVELLASRSATVTQSAAPQAAPQPLPQPSPIAEREAPPVAEAPAPSVYTPTAEYDEITPVVEESAPAAPVAEIEAQPDPWPAHVGQVPGADVSSAVIEMPVATPAEPPAEIVATPLPAEPAAPTDTAAPAATPRRRYGADVELPVEVANEDERRLHNDARRFARLLVSEIKLYNEQKVTEGRVQGDLYGRLREYIDRSREMYDKRVKPEVAGRYDYFHHEIVNTLAEGDEAKLGSAYPGATVSA
jgi:hypothetical protein